jgi:uncharacterized protein YcbK (DUF882 family)
MAYERCSSEHFTQRELECHDCGVTIVDPRLLDALEALHALGPEPIMVLSCCRCAARNSQVGGVGKSQHIFVTNLFSKPTRAADIRIGELDLDEMYRRAQLVPAFNEGGIGVYDEIFLHVDVRQRRARWARVKGVYVRLEDSKLIGGGA